MDWILIDSFLEHAVTVITITVFWIGFSTGYLVKSIRRK